MSAQALSFSQPYEASAEGRWSNETVIAQTDVVRSVIDAPIGASTFQTDSIIRSLRVVLTIMALAAIAAVFTSLVVLGPALFVPGFIVAFLMILFIGMPLILASITDAVEQEETEHPGDVVA